MTREPMKLPENIFRQNYESPLTTGGKDNGIFNIWIFEKNNNDAIQHLSKRILPKKNGIIPYPLPFPRYIKVKNIINDIQLSNLPTLKNTDLLKEVESCSLKKISELTFYENLNLGILINTFWKNKNLIIPLYKKMDENEFSKIKNINFNQIYLSENRDFFNTFPEFILTPSGSLYKNEKNEKKMNLYETQTSISPEEYLDKKISLWSSIPEKNGWRIRADKKNTNLVKKIDDFADFKEIEISL